MSDDITQEEIEQWRARMPRKTRNKTTISRILLPAHPSVIVKWADKCNKDQQYDCMLDFEVDGDGNEFLVFQVIGPETDEQYEARAMRDLRWIRAADAAWEEINREP